MGRQAHHISDSQKVLSLGHHRSGQPASAVDVQETLTQTVNNLCEASQNLGRQSLPVVCRVLEVVQSRRRSGRYSGAGIQVGTRPVAAHSDMAKRGSSGGFDQPPAH